MVPHLANLDPILSDKLKHSFFDPIRHIPNEFIKGKMQDFPHTQKNQYRQIQKEYL